MAEPSFHYHARDVNKGSFTTERTPLLIGPSRNGGGYTSSRSPTRSRRGKESKRRIQTSGVSSSPSTSLGSDRDELDDQTYGHQCCCSSARRLSRPASGSGSYPVLDTSSNFVQSPTESAGKTLAQDSHDSLPLGLSSEEVPLTSDRPAAFPSFFQNISLRLENSGSVARDHLASERTFLAYMRTSLAIVSSGVALVQLFSASSATAPQGSMHRLHTYIRPLGASTVIVGLFILSIGVMRYFTVQAAMTKGYFPVTRVATGLIAFMLTALMTLTFGILLAGKLEAKGKR